MRTVPLVLALLLLAPAGAPRAAEIHDAVAAGDRGRVEALLRADPGLVRAAGPTRDRDLPLHVAARTGNVAMAALLLDSGAEVDGLDADETTPLGVAALFRRAEVARLLIERGADVNRRDRNGSCALSWAVAGGDTAIVRVVLQAGADLNYRAGNGATLLHLACARGLWDLADRLLRRDPNIEVRDVAGATPLHYASRGGDSLRVAGVLARGAALETRDSFSLTPLYAAVLLRRAGAARALLAAGADPRAVDHDGWPMLHLAVRNDDLPIVRELVAHGCDPASPDTGGWHLSQIATETQDADLIAFLLDHGMSLAGSDSATGHVPLHVAAIKGRADVVRTLLDHGADAAARDRDGATPLDLAVRYGHTGVAALLRARGAPGGAGPAPRGLASPAPRTGEADIWYLGHSAWAVRTPRHVLVFDCGVPGMGRPPDRPSLVNGHVVPAELKGRRVTAFVSHAHADHFDRAQFRWRETLPGIRYVFGFQPDSAPPLERMDARVTRTVDGMRVTTFRANDSGVGFVVEVDGLTILHAGDHANRQRDLRGDYVPEIDFVRDRGLRPDIAFLPASGCGFGDPVAVQAGVEYTLRTLRPGLFLPMHRGFTDCNYEGPNAECRSRFPEIRTATIENPGDFVRYRRARAG